MKRMDISRDRLSTLYLTELSELDAFTQEREGQFAVAVGPEDPDVRRLVEAMAFFSARTRAAAASAVEASVRRLAAGTLDDLLVPCPAALMAQVLPDEQLVESLRLPAGLPLQATTADARVGIFTTDRALRVLPAITSGAELSRGARQTHVTIRVEALRPLSEAVTLSFYVRRLDDYRASLALFDALEANLINTHVEADEVGELPCRVEFGAPPKRRLGPESELGEPGPLAAIRSFFQLPEQELFVHVSVPPVPGGWNTLIIRLELGEHFPEEFGVTRDTFQLGVVPCSNLWSDFAQPIVCDGTLDAYPIRSAEALLSGVELHDMRGVYRSGEHGLAPIPPSAFGRHGDSYEFRAASGGAEDRARLDIEDAFEHPCRVQVDARWSQPQLWSTAVGRIALVPRTRRLPGVAFWPQFALDNAPHSFFARPRYAWLLLFAR
jgi:type VI secretion system protein ImpG